MGRYSDEIIVLSSAARTTSGDTGTTLIDAGKYGRFTAFLDVTAAAGISPTLNVKFQVQDPASLKWFDITELTFTQKTTSGNEMKTIATGYGTKLRCEWTIAGTTPSFTFSVGLIAEDN